MINYALSAIASTTKADINELKSFANPPKLVMTVCQLGFLLTNSKVPVKNIQWKDIKGWLGNPQAWHSLLGKIESKEKIYTEP